MAQRTRITALSAFFHLYSEEASKSLVKGGVLGRSERKAPGEQSARGRTSTALPPFISHQCTTKKNSQNFSADIMHEKIQIN